MNIVLRRFSEKDAARISVLVGDEDVSKWTSNIPHPYSEQDAVDWINQIESEESECPYAVELDGALVACVSYWPFDSKSYEVGYWVGKDFWGKSICTRALKLLMSADHFPSAVDVYAKIFENNIGSQRVLEKCGFSFLESGTIFRGQKELGSKIYVRRAAT